jgi:hypothetical protein
VIAVRILQDGAVAREQVFRSQSVTVGRAPECDVVIFDPSISRLHARVEMDAEGRIVLRDLDSRNGVRVATERVGEVAGTPSIRCWLGAVLIEVVALSAETTLELRRGDLGELEQRRTVVNHLGYVALGMLAWLAGQVIEPSFWSPWQQNRSVGLLQNTLGAAAGIPIFAFVLLGVLKAVGRRIRLADTLRAVALVLLVGAGLRALALAVYYALPSPAYGTVNGLLTGLTTVIIFSYLAGVRRSPSRRFRLVWALAIAALSLGLVATARLAARRTGVPAVDHHVQMPLGGVVGPSRDVDAYLHRVEEAARTAADAAEGVRRRQGAD